VDTKERGKYNLLVHHKKEKTKLMEQLLTQKTWNDFRKILNDEEAFYSFINYYSALLDWVKNNIEIFDTPILQANRITELLNLKHPEMYIVDNTGLSLGMESERMFSYRPETLDGLMMSITDTLWELITIMSEKNCPICDDGGLGYFIIEIASTKKRELILECNTCIYFELVSGEKWNEENKILRILPANKNDLEKFNAEYNAKNVYG